MQSTVTWSAECSAILKFNGGIEAEKRIVSGQAWEEFCDALKASGAAMMFPGTPKDGFNQAEGNSLGH